MNEGQILCDKCSEINYEMLSDFTIDRAKYFFLDYLGVAIRGATYISSKQVQKVVTALNSKDDDAVIIGTSLKAKPTFAAIANGAAAHSLEMDDVANEASLHPGVAIMSAVLDSSFIKDVSGKKFIEAIITGYEVMIRLGISIDPAAHYKQGFHPTGTCGTFGSAIAAAKIFKLEKKKILNALGIAGSQAAGSMEFLAGGSYTKRLHPGWAAHAGIIAAMLAREGFTGPATILEGNSGFMNSYSDKSDISKLLIDWGNPYKIEETSIKPHSCCRYKQGPIDCILKIMNQNSIKSENIERVFISMLKTGFPIVAEPRELKINPRSVVDAQFSMPFGAAVAILKGRANLNEYVDENLQDNDVKEMMKKIECIEDEEIEKEFPKKWAAKVKIRTKDGEEYISSIDYPKGDPENPLSWQELIDKFYDLTESILQKRKQEEIIRRVKELEKENSIVSFIRTLLI